MRKLLIAASAAVALLAGPAVTTSAQAAPAVAAAGIGTAVDTLNVVDHVQYYWHRHRYCWYPAGWHGPGWYWCGYGARVGFGWGGPVGWRGWTYRAPVVVRRGPVVVHRGPVVVHRGRTVVIHRHR